MTLDFAIRLRQGNFQLEAVGQVPRGGITALIGPSGAGKSTLLRVLAGLETRATGHIRLGDETWLSAEQQVPAHRRRVGLVFQDGALLPHLTVAGNLDYALKRAQKPRLARNEAISLTGIRNLLEQRPSQLSGGQRQRVALARSLVTDASVLLLDEPLSALDQQARQPLIAILRQLPTRVGIPVLYVSHSLEEVGLLADHALLIEAGRICASGGLRPLLTDLEQSQARLPHALTPIDGSIRSHDVADGLTAIAWGRETLWIPRVGGEPGDGVRLLLHARDLSLALERPSDSSILNSVPVQVLDWYDHGNGQCTVRLETETGALLARITRRSARLLDLHPGQLLFALIKSVALPEMPVED
ncbi:molybdenum ABC transporter ATP-binding protein [Mangrovitalea sediminis]|uniref:molybdenum ABC transporter ATP-binding protein n=1 Tax=Mangrovitalea sediminis TaxID=1982043 RepID=UPI000BE515C0|nr:molybdenum ABC transporter ATP-binding protein [Mangrovitalea sediminis]